MHVLQLPKIADNFFFLNNEEEFYHLIYEKFLRSYITSNLDINVIRSMYILNWVLIFSKSLVLSFIFLFF